jgi:hypothetical protein
MRKSLLLSTLLMLLVLLAAPVTSSAGIIFSVEIAPPPLPVYDQPVCPGEGYLWTPGYWAYADGGYFWVPGTWVLIPQPGYLWTPGYWGWANGAYVFNQGYWGPHVGFYGGINYGFGYVGSGYAGGYWNNGNFFYNRSVNNVTNVTNIRNVYNKTVVVNNTTINRVSYNGGSGGITVRPTAQEQAAQHDRHIPPISAQAQHVQMASTNRQLYESQNHGRPAIAASSRPAQFSGSGVVAARAAASSYRPPVARQAGPAHSNGAVGHPNAGAAHLNGAPAAQANTALGAHTTGTRAAHPDQPAPTRVANATGHPSTAVHPKDLPPLAHSTPPNTGNASRDEQYQKDREGLVAKQQQEREQLQRKQDQEHQQLAKEHANAKQQQELEKQHQQQTAQMAQQHASQAQSLHAKQKAPPSPKPSPAPKEKERTRS